MTRSGRAARVPGAAASTLAMAMALAACGHTQREPGPGVLVVSNEQASSWVRNFNPLTPAAAPRWPTWAGIYEPLMVFSAVRDAFVPWLATSYAWREGHRSLRVTTRPGVLWSDGRPFTARDVAFSFELLRRFPALDRRGLWRYLSAVKAVDDTTVDFAFSRVFIPGLDDVLGQLIVPEHVWSQVADPVSFRNETPVATGPFTEVLTFQSQLYELGRNPRYWQPGKPKVKVLRFPAFPSNERANLGLVFDEVDWAGNFVPAIERVYVKRAPRHHCYWFPLTGSTVFLYANTTRAPFNDVRVRKALSLSIDRQLVVDVAVFRYSRPADATGLSDAYAGWRDPSVGASDWMRHDAAAANALLDAAGYKRGADGVRRLPDGKPWSYQVLAVSGWSDWVRAAQIIARGLRKLGIDASVRTYDFSAWSQRVGRGDFDLTLGWSFEGPTPYTFYRWLMSSATVLPLGADTTSNWHRYASPKADALLAEFEREATPAGQRRIANALQHTFATEAPAIPLYPNPSWAEYNTRRFRGFPSAANPYADASPNKYDRGETLLVLTSIEPR